MFGEFKRDPSSMEDTWDQTIQQLQRFTPTGSSGEQLVEAHAYLEILDKILVAAQAQNGQ